MSFPATCQGKIIVPASRVIDALMYVCWQHLELIIFMGSPLYYPAEVPPLNNLVRLNYP